MKEQYKNESELKKAGLKYLESLPRCKVLKTDNMALRVGNGRKVKTRNPGMSDHHLCLNGRFVAVEAKMPGENIRKDQYDYLIDIGKAGGYPCVYHSVAELKEKIEQVLKEIGINQ